MTDAGDAGGRGQPRRDAPSAREARLKAALKANMARRKAQGRARAGGQDMVSGGEGDHRPDPDRQEDENG